MMFRGKILFVLIATMLMSMAFSKERCGTSRIAKNRKGRIYTSPILANTDPSVCFTEDYYDSVYTKTTEHFQIFYTQSGPNKTNADFVDSVASSAEYAWRFHIQHMGMRTPKGNKESHHYRQPVQEGKYPIEILDFGLLRNTNYFFGGICFGCYGSTLPSDDESFRSEMVIDNDFYTVPPQNATLDTIQSHEKKCVYNLATDEVFNIAHNYSYVDQWAKGIKVTVVHEFYHAVQFSYVDMSQWSFWFEASASGIEEIAAPEVDDYFNYLPTMFNSVGIPLDQMIEDYGAGIFFIYLYNFIGKNTDKLIWEEFSKNPNNPFQDQLNHVAENKKLSADSIFHDFATKLLFSGKMNSFLDSSNSICSDQKKWPTIRTTQIADIQHEFSPSVNNLSYRYYHNGTPNLDNFKGLGSAVLFKGNSAKITPFKVTRDVAVILAELESDPLIDSVLWVFSNFMREEYMPALEKDSILRAFPTPWREGSLCFSPLPRNKNFIEIRNRRGNLITREKYTGSIHCIAEEKIRELMVPGLYRFRVGNHGKMKDLLVIY